MILSTPVLSTLLVVLVPKIPILTLIWRFWWFYIGKKNLIEGLLTFFFSRMLFYIITASGKTIQKILGFFFKVLFLGYPVPSFRNATFTLFKVTVKNCMKIYYRNLYGRWFCHLSRVCIAWDGGKGSLNPVWGGGVRWRCDVLSV